MRSNAERFGFRIGLRVARSMVSHSATLRVLRVQCPVESRSVSQHPLKNAARKSKKSWEFTTLSPLKSAVGSESKNAVRKSKKSWEFTASSALKSASQSDSRVTIHPS